MCSENKSISIKLSIKDDCRPNFTLRYRHITPAKVTQSCPSLCRGQLKHTALTYRRTVCSGAAARLPALSYKADKICFKSVKNFGDESNLQDLLQYSLQKRM